MLVRLAFSVMIQVDAEILLIDEVLAVGDAAFQQKCFEEFARIRRSGTTMLLVTHDMGSVQRFCDRAMLIEHGHCVEIGAPEPRRHPLPAAELRRRRTGRGGGRGRGLRADPRRRPSTRAPTLPTRAQARAAPRRRARGDPRELVRRRGGQAGERPADRRGVQLLHSCALQGAPREPALRRELPQLHGRPRLGCQQPLRGPFGRVRSRRGDRLLDRVSQPLRARPLPRDARGRRGGGRPRVA